jgi:8-oxo-dGTP diphosphatase
MSDDFTATLPRKRMGAGVLLSDPNGRVLLVEPTYKDHWVM